MVDWPKISIVTPCFNHDAFIAETIESVLSQGYPNLEFIVVNDGSTDNSAAVIERYQKDLTKLVTLNGHRDSPVFAINRGFAETSGELMGWISSDDVLLPKSLFSVARVFMDVPEASWITGLASTINSRSELINSRPRPNNLYDFLTDYRRVIQQESTFFRRSLWNESGGMLEEASKQAFDTELWTRFIQKAKLFHVSAPLGAFRQGNQSRSTNDPGKFAEWNQRSLGALRARSTRRDFVLARIWGILNHPYFPGILGVLPDRMLKKIFPAFVDCAVNYDFQNDRWSAATRSAFKR